MAASRGVRAATGPPAVLVAIGGRRPRRCSRPGASELGDARGEGRGRRFKTKATPKKNNQRRRKDDVSGDDEY